MPLTRHLPVNDPLVTLRVTLVNNPLNNPDLNIGLGLGLNCRTTSMPVKLRLGCPGHALWSSSVRMSESLMHNAECPCCGHDSETTRINHTTSIFDCLKLDDVRSGVFQRLETILPERAICRTRSAWLCSWGMPVIRPPSLTRRRMRTSRLALPFSDVPFSAGWVS